MAYAMITSPILRFVVLLAIATAPINVLDIDQKKFIDQHQKDHGSPSKRTRKAQFQFVHHMQMSRSWSNCNQGIHSIVSDLKNIAVFQFTLLDKNSKYCNKYKNVPTEICQKDEKTCLNAD